MRKYLDDIGVTERPDTWEDKPHFKEQREQFGFDERETYSLDYSFILWLYERLKMYLDKSDKIIDLTFHKYTFRGKEYTQKEMIVMLITKLEYVFHSATYGISDDILEIFTLIVHDLWW